MAVIGKVQLQADKDVAAGTEISLCDLFTFEERSKKFEVNDDVRRDQTNLKVHVAKLGVLDAVSDANLPHGFNTSLATLLTWPVLSKKVKVSERVKKDDPVEITVEK